MRRLVLYFSIIISLLSSLTLDAQDKAPKKSKVRVKDIKDAVELPYTDEFLDTVNVDKVFSLNDYTLIGFESGVSFNRMRFNPAYSQSVRFTPEYYELSVTKYGKMFGYMPYFGLRFGVAYSHEAYKFKENKETGYIANIEGANEAVYDVIELPIMSHFHMDGTHFKVTAEVGPYAAYRMNIERMGEWIDPEVQYSFLDTDIRFEHGLKGGVGAALVFSPFEIFVNGKVKYSWTNLYQPDYISHYYYRFAYPFDIIVTAGLQIQMTKRTGKTKAMLRKQAKEIVYGEN